jgi:hypothetical protein
MPKATIPAGGTDKWIDLGMNLALILACAVALTPNLADADIWGHVRYGLDMMTDGLPLTTTYSYTANGHPWVNHENLSEVTLALVATFLGSRGLLIMKCLLGLGVISLIIHNARRQHARLLSISAVALLVSVNITYHWSVRPQVFSYSLFAALLALVTWCFTGWQGQWRLPYFRRWARASEDVTHPDALTKINYLWFSPLIMLVWANTHGAFVAGFCIFASLLGCRCLELLTTWGRQSWSVVGKILGIVMISALVTLINPYGVGLHQWLLQSLGNPRPEIVEWHAPDLFNVLTIPLLLVTTLWVIGLVGSRRPLDFSYLFVMTVTLWQAYTHQRHIPFFVIAFGFWMAPHVDCLFRRLFMNASQRELETNTSPVFRVVVAAGFLLVFSLITFRLVDRLGVLQVKRNEFPVSAFQYMAGRDLRGNLVVTYNWAQYAIAAFGQEESGEPRMRVGFDGRFRTCYPQRIVDMHFDFIMGEGGPERRWRGNDSHAFDPALILEYQCPDLVLISRNQEPSVHTMQQHADQWTLLYQDELAQLWGRSKKYDDPQLATYLPETERRITEQKQIGYQAWPAFPCFGNRSSQLVRAETGSNER